MSVVGNTYWQDAANAAADTYGIPRAIFNSLVNVESAWNAYTISPKGAIGLTQLEPGTASDLGVDPWNPVDNLNGGAAYLSQQFKQFGNWPQALAAYNAGPNNLPAGQAYANQVLQEAAAAGYTPTGATTGTQTAAGNVDPYDPVLAAGNAVLGLFGIAPATPPTQAQAVAGGPAPTMQNILLYGGGAIVLIVVAIWAIGALFKGGDEKPVINVSPGDVIRGGEALAA